MTITLPDEWRERLESRAKLHGFATVEEFMLNLAEAEIHEAESSADYAGPTESSPRNRAELDAMLEAGMASGPPIRVTPEFWAKLRQRARTGSGGLTPRNVAAIFAPDPP